MRAHIINNMGNPKEMEKLFRSDKNLFKKEFNLLYPQLSDRSFAEFWNERLNYEPSGISWGSRQEILFVGIASIIAVFIAKLPVMLGIAEDVFYLKNVGFIVFPMLGYYFAMKNRLPLKQMLFMAACLLISVFYINVLPASFESQSLVLACIHLPIFLWAITGYAFVGSPFTDHGKRLDYLRYNADLLVIYTLIAIAGMILTGITIQLFSLIGLEISQFYFEYVVISGAAACPILATQIIQHNPHLIDKVSPLIARIFSPIVLVTLVIYLIAIVSLGKDPYNDREFLLFFNALLIGVMAIILFSIVESTKSSGQPVHTWVLFLLSVTTAMVNAVALAAILFRISEWGITPNRLAVLGGNILILIHLLIVAYKLFTTLRKKTTLERVGRSIAGYLPVYAIWATVVVFLFPLIFGLK